MLTQSNYTIVHRMNKRSFQARGYKQEQDIVLVLKMLKIQAFFPLALKYPTLSMEHRAVIAAASL